MLPAFESHLLPGTARLTFDRPSDDGTAGKWGVEICKDMDFPLLARQYSNDGARLMLVPAWDFVADGWLHGRMAILRGVESGFSIARSVKQGILTLSDSRGRVLAQHVTRLRALRHPRRRSPSGQRTHLLRPHWRLVRLGKPRFRRSPSSAVAAQNGRRRPVPDPHPKLIRAKSCLASKRTCVPKVLKPLPIAPNRAMLITKLEAP